ncbi:MAG: gas vesicle protein GvpD P-loop domain-containing protein [Candidatus Eisenbacteria bacterium]|nr:gas vesicle protein GvpD [Candidatus Eisenbacteria bacterium]
MDRETLNRRSPMRVFERSIHGGLGRGNIGVILGRAGTGRTAFLIGMALDALLRDRKVLHVSTRASSDKVREFYEEVFHELAEATHLEDRLRIRLQIERNRMIHTFLGGGFSLERLAAAIDYMTRHVHFEPSVVILQGSPDWEQATEAEIGALADFAGRLQCELWLEGQVHRDGEKLDQRGVPERIARFDSHLAVLLSLQQNEDHVRLQLLKDHGSADLAAMHIELDPKTLLMVWR